MAQVLLENTKVKKVSVLVEKKLIEEAENNQQN